MIGDLRFSKLDFDFTCAYTRNEYAPNTESRRYMLELKAYCNKIKPFVTYNNMQPHCTQHFGKGNKIVVTSSN